jgi:GNAT superfamily N-acetyltransferase
MSDGYSRPRPLAPEHRLESFGCGSAPLDDFLKHHALSNQQGEASRTYVSTSDGETVAAYSTLAAGAVAPDVATSRVLQGQAAHPVPIVLQARLAVDLRHQARGLGTQMVLDALARSAAAADLIGVRAVAVHAKDDAAAAFYRRFGFEPSPSDRFHLFLLMKDIRKTLELT